jgi:sugar lactone lactonase YvrE
MRSLDFSRYALTSCVAAAILAGCGGSQPPSGAPGAMPQTSATATHTPRWSALKPRARGLGYKATAPLLYVANYTVAYDDVRVYRADAKNPGPLATISYGIDTPTGACIDGRGTLYVTNEPTSGSGWISEYPLGKTAPSKTVTDGVSAPAFCAIDAKGNLWVTNLGGPNVTEYLYGSKKPHIVITDSLHFPVGIAIDHSGNLYVANGVGASQQNVEVYSSGSKSPSRTITNGIASPVGITVDSNGTLYVTNVDQNNIAEYRPGQDYPFQTITSGLTDPSGVTVNKKGLLYVTNYGSSTVAEFPPASLTPSKRQISKGLYNPEGIAYYPALLP